MSDPVISEARAEQLANENPHLRCRRSLVNCHYAELALEVLGDELPWCSSHPTILTELGRIAEHDPEQARLVAAGLEAEPPRVKAAVLEIRRARNGVSTPGDGQLAVELINSAFDFGERYPSTTEEQIIEALGLAQRAVMRQREART